MSEYNYENSIRAVSQKTQTASLNIMIAMRQIEIDRFNALPEDEKIIIRLRGTEPKPFKE